MRITSGRFKGRALHTPPDRRTRPTSDKVRQAVFNILVHGDVSAEFALDGATVIDVFAGTGAMGLEAISRGAAYCLFVEEAAAARAIIRQNIEDFGLSGVTKIWRRDGTALGPRPPGAGGPFTLAFLDPPYRRGLLIPGLRALAEGDWLSRNAIVVCEAAHDEEIELLMGFEPLDVRLYGESKIFILRYRAEMS
ncbi:MAG: 16S rRNA (guanine(966)-N(2))-methyltransferase RsmD [Alphaproteobacteria bacterium]|nr:16S rRNA (guanine(966)-N(2))-methyltransferase RsmD [Alphaproteobacteria bacterium]